MSEERKKISEILVKWGMPTRQAAISEIIQLISRVRAEAVAEVKEKTFTLLDIEIEAWMNVHETQQRTFTTENFIQHLRKRMEEEKL